MKRSGIVFGLSSILAGIFIFTSIPMAQADPVAGTQSYQSGQDTKKPVKKTHKKGRKKQHKQVKKTSTTTNADQGQVKEQK